ncbi:hypothetical protein LPJ59_002655 [Coemansia sp. RSA 2399]|nr:hypothetical protein LPJ59_002655 [Coemansia sp. RSA 2399]KAJ1903419.1 hypothetical protein LPJ81_003072 [Coemansia sp. IMI 209127]
MSDEKFQTSLALYTTLASRPTTDSRTRLVCLAKKTSLLDMHPAIRTFDASCRKIRASSCRDAKTHLPFSASLGAMLADRVATIRDLALAYKESGDAINTSVMYDRAVQLLEALPEETRKTTGCGLSDMLLAWADVEESLGRTTKASKIRDRSRKDNTSRSIATK